MLYGELNELMCDIGSLSSVFKCPLACSLSLIFAFCKAEGLTLSRWMKAVQALVRPAAETQRLSVTLL